MVETKTFFIVLLLFYVLNYLFIKINISLDK